MYRLHQFAPGGTDRNLTLARLRRLDSEEDILGVHVLYFLSGWSCTMYHVYITHRTSKLSKKLRTKDKIDFLKKDFAIFYNFLYF